ncbi:MAG: pyridoxamine 5'-phosphate oxidase family protein [Candidatus Omnitrophica bacterium]|nr:pyridoxamine 5'-phosphate oxidase family protein [Candidatus Omnitrophota bacterium]
MDLGNLMPLPLEEVYEILSSNTSAALGTVADGKPFTSLTHYAFDPERGSLILFLSRLARHTKNLEKTLCASLLVEGKSLAAGHPLDRPRVTITGKARQVQQPDEIKRSETIFLKANPQSKMLLELKDFGFYLLEPEEVYYVKGFGSVSRFASLKP